MAQTFESSSLNQLPQAIRLAGTKVQRMTDYYETADRLVAQELRGDLEAASAQLISHENVKREWKPLSSTKKAKQEFSSDRLAEVGVGTKCRLEWKLDSIVIFGDGDQDIEQAVKRLEAIEKAHVSTLHINNSKLMVNRLQIIENMTTFLKTTLNTDFAWPSLGRQWTSRYS